MSEASSQLVALLLPEADADLVEYLSGTVDSFIEDGGGSLEDLSEMLSELLVGNELVPDAEAAEDICKRIHQQIGSAAAPAAPASSSDAPPALLDKKITMGNDEVTVDLSALGLSGKDVDAFGNRVSAVARANANWKSDSLVALEKAKAEEEEETPAGGVAIGMRIQTASQKEEQAERERKTAMEGERARERACEQYLDSKAAGGSRDVSIKSMILLAPNGKPLLEDGAALRLSQGRKYGLVGRNGTGKTTLLKAISSYEVNGFPPHLKVVHVEQDPSLNLSQGALQTVLGFDLERRVLERRRAEFSAALDQALAEPPPARDLPEAERDKAQKVQDKVVARLQRRLGETETLLAEVGIETAATRARAILTGLQFTPAMMDAPLRTLSGGWRMRATLAAALYSPCDVLLLDEPTNHLDFPALVWLTDFLSSCSSTCLIVSHDRGFLDAVVTDVIQLKERGLHYYKGNITTYAQIQHEQYVSQKRRYEAQQKERAHMQEMIDKYDVRKNSSEENKKAKRTPGVVAQMKAREKALNKMEEEGLVRDPDAKTDEATVAIEFPQPWPLKRPLLVSMSGVSFHYKPPAGDGAPSTAAASSRGLNAPPPLLSNVSLSVSLGARIGILGANGCGKSTLLKLMTQALEPVAGEVFLNRGARTAVFAQHFVDQLDLYATATEFLGGRFPGSKELEIRNRLGRFGLQDWMTWLPMGKLSGGQKSRVVLCAITWAQPTLLFLDEPTNHLDLETVDVLATALKSFKGAVVCVSHDVYFLEHAMNEFWSLRDGTVSCFANLSDAKQHAKARPADGLEVA